MHTTSSPKSSEVTLDSLLGVWRRVSIRWPDGREDISTKVFWLQGSKYYADIRIPAGRPAFFGVDSLAKCTSEQTAWLAKQEGFAGELVQNGDRFHWIRDVDFQPPGGLKDIGRLRFADPSRDRMIEDGVEQPYTEVWERIHRGESTHGQALVLKLDSNHERGWFVAVGDHFLLALDRRASSAASMPDMEISHGLRSGPSGPWRITHSTFPWREGSPVFEPQSMRVDWDQRVVTQSLENGQSARTWHLLESSKRCDAWFPHVVPSPSGRGLG
jgi:hypothetical protein